MYRLKSLFSFIKRMYRQSYCTHVDIRFMYNISGDAIIYHGYNRSVYICTYCECKILKPNLKLKHD